MHNSTQLNQTGMLVLLVVLLHFNMGRAVSQTPLMWVSELRSIVSRPSSIDVGVGRTSISEYTPRNVACQS